MEALKKFPYWILALASIAFSIYSYYDFENSTESPKTQIVTQISVLKQEIIEVVKKVEEAKQFEKNLENKKNELTLMNDELQSKSVILTSEIDIASFVRLVSSEAKKLGLKVFSIKPSAEQTEKYYAYTRIAVEYEAVFVQLVQFLRVLSETKKINRVSEFNIIASSTPDPTGRFTPLRGVLEIDVFRYIYTEEDKLGKPSEPGAEPKESASPQEATQTSFYKSFINKNKEYALGDKK